MKAQALTAALVLVGSVAAPAQTNLLESRAASAAALEVAASNALQTASVIVLENEIEDAPLAWQTLGAVQPGAFQEQGQLNQMSSLVTLPECVTAPSGLVSF